MFDHDIFSGVKFKSFIFRDFCRECVDEWRRTGKRPMISVFSPACHVDVYRNALNIGSFAPVAGDAVRIIGYPTVFGRVRLYSFERSDFEWTYWRDEEDRLEAKKWGFPSVKEYRTARKNEWLEQFYASAMTNSGLTREEAEMLEPALDFYSVFAKEAKRCGKTFEEVKRQYDEKFLRPDPETVEFCENMIAYPDAYAEQCVAAGVLEGKLKEHLNRCDTCNNFFVDALAKETQEHQANIRSRLGLLTVREAFLWGGAKRHGVTPEEFEKIYDAKIILKCGGENCLTAKERILYAKSGELPAERNIHIENCPGCKAMAEADRTEFASGHKLTGVA